MKQRVWQGLLGLVLLTATGFWLQQNDFVQAVSNSIGTHGVTPVSEIQTPVQAKPFHPQAGAPYRFIVFGDWGAGTQFQKDVARQTVSLYGKAPFDAAALLGDNIYEYGDVKKYGKAYFTDTYAPLIAHGVRFIVALGNHDVRGGFQDDQLRFFNMPGYYYSVNRGPVTFFVINSNNFADDAVQQKWLDRALGESQAEWKIVMGHHPIYSSGEHGMNAGLQKTLEPILVRHQVQMYLAGHDHDYERFTLIKGVQHIVSGGGGAYLRDFAKILPNSLVRIKAHHFLSFELKNDILRMQVIDKTGNVIDTAQWEKVSNLRRLGQAS